MRLLPCFLAFGFLLAVGEAAAVDPPAPHGAATEDSPPFTVAQLERTFWVCDYLATTEGVHGAHIVTCRYATDELKKQKFGGSFRELLQWWRENKVAEHRKLAEGRISD